jgi:hypothetical protein
MRTSRSRSACSSWRDRSTCVLLGETDLVRTEAEPLLVEGTLLQLFAEWALACVDRDADAFRRAQQHFRALGIDLAAATVTPLVAPIGQ